MDVSHLQCFVTLAEELHFGRAAKRLGLSTPTLSRRLQDLEDEVGARLFVRSSRTVDLTDAGRALHDPARAALAAFGVVENVARDISRGAVGQPKLLYSPGNGQLVGRLLQRVRQAYPQVEVRLEQQLSATIVGEVRAGRADVGVCRNAPILPGIDHVLLRRSSVEWLVVPPDHPFATRSSMSLEELAVADGVVVVLPFEADEGGRYVSDALRRLGNVELTHRPVRNEAQYFDWIAAGFGVGFMTSAMVAGNARPDVVAIPFTGDALRTSDDVLVWRMDNDGPTVRQLILAARELAAVDGPRAATPARSDEEHLA